MTLDSQTVSNSNSSVIGLPWTHWKKPEIRHQTTIPQSRKMDSCLPQTTATGRCFPHCILISGNGRLNWPIPYPKGVMWCSRQSVPLLAIQSVWTDILCILMPIERRMNCYFMYPHAYRTSYELLFHVFSCQHNVLRTASSYVRMPIERLMNC